jgi:hypothetical protein
MCGLKVIGADLSRGSVTREKLCGHWHGESLMAAIFCPTHSGSVTVVELGANSFFADGLEKFQHCGKN